MHFGHISQQARASLTHRLIQQQTTAMIHSLLISGVDPAGVEEEEVLRHVDIRDEDNPTYKQIHIRSVAYFKKAQDIARQTLQKG